MALAVHPRVPASKRPLLEELRERALIHEAVTLSNGQTSDYYVDVKRALLAPSGFRAVGPLVVEFARSIGAEAVGGMTIGADPVALAALAADDRQQLQAFLVRKNQKEHGMQRWIEGPKFPEGTKCLVVDDVVTTGRSTVDAINRVVESGLDVIGALAVVDRLAGGADRVKAAINDRPFEALLTIDDLHPDRTDRD